MIIDQEKIVERLIQNVEQQLRRFKLDEDESYLNVKELIHQFDGQLQNCKQKTIQISPFEAHHGRKPNTDLSILISSPSHNNLSRQNVKKYCLDLKTIGKEVLIIDEAWYYEAILSDNEVQKKMEEIVEKTKAREEVEGG